MSQEHIRGRDGFETASSGWLLAALLCRPAQKVNSTSRAFPKRGSKKATTGKKSTLRKSERSNVGRWQRHHLVPLLCHPFRPFFGISSELLASQCGIYGMLA